jgi:hypothetical protein
MDAGGTDELTRKGPQMDRAAAISTLVAAVAVALLTTLSGHWDGIAQDAQAQSSDAVAEAEQANLQAIYAATGYPPPSPSPTPKSDFSPIISKFTGDTFGGRRLPAETDVSGWASVRSYYSGLANEDRVGLLFLTLAIALLAAAVPVGVLWGRRLLWGGRVALVIGLGAGVWSVVQATFGF